MTEKERLLKIMELQEMNAKQFAEEVGIQPGTISNILKDRNKPSLDVLQRVLLRFSQVSPEWLILGTGSIYRQKSDSQQTLFDVPPIDEQPSARGMEMPQVASLEIVRASHSTPVGRSAAATETVAVKPRKVKKITILYDDGTFQEME